jgi:hypothetical protein
LEGCLIIVSQLFICRHSSAGIATGYGIDGPRIESRCGRGIPHQFRQAVVPAQPPVQRVSGLSPGVKLPGRDAEQPPTSSAEVKEGSEL